VKEAQMIINTFLDDIVTNTYAFIQLKQYLPQWRNKDELFDLGIINIETHRQVIKKLKQRWFSMYLIQEHKLGEKIKRYKEQLEYTKISTTCHEDNIRRHTLQGTTKVLSSFLT
jgi:hypothetical protein